MNVMSQVDSARAFARSLNILLKYVRMYGLAHQRTRAQVDVAWSELAKAAAPETGLLLGTADGKLLIDGIPLDGYLESSFASLLTSANIGSLHFTYGIQRRDLEKLLAGFHASKPAEVAEQLKATFGDNGSIKVNEIRFVADTEAGLAEQLAARALAERTENLVPWLQDPEKLLQLILAAEGSDSNGGSGEGNGGNGGSGSGEGSGGSGSGIGSGTGSGGGGPVFEEESVTKTLRLLASVARLQGRSDAESSVMRELAQEKDACRVLRQAMLALPIEGMGVNDCLAGRFSASRSTVARRNAIDQRQGSDENDKAAHKSRDEARLRTVAVEAMNLHLPGSGVNAGAGSCFRFP